MYSQTSNSSKSTTTISPFQWASLPGALACMCVFVLTLLVSSPAAADQCDGYQGGKKTLTQLITDLENDAFTARECATRELINRLPMLTDKELQQVVDSYAGASLEASRRLDRVITTMVTNKIVGSPSAQLALGLARVEVISTAGGKVKFKLGQSFTGETTPATFAALLSKWVAFRNRLELANAADAAKKLSDLGGFIVDKEFKNLNLQKDGKAATKFEVEDTLFDASKLTDKAKEELKKKVGVLPSPNYPSLLQVANSGPVNLGLTVAMNIQNVLSPGLLEYAWSDQQLAYGPPPTGFVSYGPTYDIQVDQELTVNGAVSFSIQYGDSTGNGYGIVDPSQLAIVRIASGEYQVLSCMNDLGAHTITGVYSVSSGSQGLDQFGEFMLVGPAYVGASGVKFAQAGQDTVLVYSSGSPAARQ